jgi:hypothetical protein
MKSTPWNLDAYRAFKKGVTEDELLINRPIKDFLEQENKFFLIGAKGLGKTIFLRYKSYLLHEEYGDSIQFNESNKELTENLNIHPSTFTKEELFKFNSLDLWILLWELSLWIMAFRLFKLPINPELEKLISRSEDLGGILTRLLNHRNKIDAYREFVMEFQENRKKIQSGVVIFIDDTDQTFHNFLIIPHRSDADRKDNPSVSVWINVQIGLMNAIYNLNRQNGHIKIYATIRREAWEAWDSELKINFRNNVCMLQYDKDEIRLIFEKNLQMLKEADLVERGRGRISVKNFLGFDEMEHPFAKDVDGNKRRELAFDFIYRHTYGRPREIITIGKLIHEKIVSEAYRRATPAEQVEKIRRLVNSAGNELFTQYKEEIVPYLDEEKLLQFIEKVRSNVITKDDRLMLDLETLKIYVNIGLIGYARVANNIGTIRQFFNPPATYNYRKNATLPDHDFLLIHSTMDALLVNKHIYGNFYNQYNIIGDGYMFFPKVDGYIQRLEHYVPRQISGNRMNAGNEAAGHAFPLSRIYERFFNFTEYPQYQEKLSYNWKTANQILGLLARICYARHLEKKFGDEIYKEKRAAFVAELGQLQVARRYNSTLASYDQPGDLDRFLDKLIGRYIALGAYLVINMRIEWIHELLVEGRFKFEAHPERKPTAFTYLGRSFFVYEMKQKEPRDPNNGTHRGHKQKIYDNLSEYEQQSIRDFARTSCDDVHYQDWIEDESHKKWLLENMICQIWQPLDLPLRR